MKIIREEIRVKGLNTSCIVLNPEKPLPTEVRELLQKFYEVTQDLSVTSRRIILCSLNGAPFIFPSAEFCRAIDEFITKFPHHAAVITPRIESATLRNSVSAMLELNRITGEALAWTQTTGYSDSGTIYKLRCDSLEQATEIAKHLEKHELDHVSIHPVVKIVRSKNGHTTSTTNTHLVQLENPDIITLMDTPKFILPTTAHSLEPSPTERKVQSCLPSFCIRISLSLGVIGLILISGYYYNSAALETYLQDTPLDGLAEFAGTSINKSLNLATNTNY